MSTKYISCFNLALFKKLQIQIKISAPVGASNLNLAISYRLKFQGFLYSDHYNILNEFQSKMSKWFKENKIKWKDTVYDGLENAPKAFIGLFKGENIGKTLVKI